ncbi:hypothetical protein BD324DRAFT_649610 [Kockovaella imperatae]|uniref:Uncharacterized protein n=1 Tax=Kockovaella imperatae TaxID=4999 RepID=A0A1Y1UJJ9_9TREE|nr:hypothetical protein BD324DRAFT_649610 [Kockovaella imperatae]ORX38231.1 hypothetical protein BD324DRAFT_649610 [Kockovaella imperatae]
MASADGRPFARRPFRARDARWNYPPTYPDEPVSQASGPTPHASDYNTAFTGSHLTSGSMADTKALKSGDSDTEVASAPMLRLTHRANLAGRPAAAKVRRASPVSGRTG